MPQADFASAWPAGLWLLGCRYFGLKFQAAKHVVALGRDVARQIYGSANFPGDFASNYRIGRFVGTLAWSRPVNHQRFKPRTQFAGNVVKGL
jgi:hypothetical protein